MNHFDLAQTFSWLLVGFGLVHGLFMLCVFLKKHGNAAKAPMAMLATIVFALIEPGFSQTVMLMPGFHRAGALLASAYLIGPVLYLYTLGVTGQLPTVKTIAKHLGLFTAATLIFTPLNWQTAIIQELPLWLLDLLLVVQGLVLVYYFRAVIAVLADKESMLKTQFSNEAVYQFNWIRFVVGSYIGFFIVVMIAVTIQYLNGHTTLSGVSFYQLGLLGWLYVFSYCSLIYGPTKQPVEMPQNPKPQRIKENQSSGHITRLQRIMQDEQLFLQADLTLTQLADKIGLGASALSELLNNHLNIKFYDYVNGFRVDYAHQLLCDPANGKTGILEICHQSGFNNKSTFNRVFKAKLGQTPSQLRLQNVNP